jgi:phosphoserine phosphatase
VSEVREGYRSVVFDCDSTLAAVEGIDELAGPHAGEVRALTEAAMEGRISLEEVYGRRLEIIRPDRRRVEALGEAYVRALVPDARAVAVTFAGDGSYAGFEADSPLARSGGKREVVEAWGLPRPSLLVGDGMTDLEAAPAVDLFAAYMGVAFRAAVAAGAGVVLEDPSLAPVLSLAAGREGRRRIAGSRFAELLDRGDRLLAQADPAEP